MVLQIHLGGWEEALGLWYGQQVPALVPHDMFAQHLAPPPSRFAGFTVLSVAIHAVVIAALIFWSNRPKPLQEKEVQITFVAARAAPPPPPPPPPPAPRKTTPKVTPKPKELVIPKEIKPLEPPKEEKPPEPEPESVAEPVEGGQEGGQEGGVIGGVVGGVVGGVGGGTGTVAEPVKPKNVPPFVIQRDVVRQVSPKLSEVFKQTHRNAGTITGMYRICVGTDGKVFDVIPVKNVPGADEDIISGIKDGWEYKPQKVPVCFLYNIPITIH